MRVAFAGLPGKTDVANEDWAGASLDVAVALDGVTSPQELESGCRHGTPWYVRQLGSALLRNASDESCALNDALAEAIMEVASLHSSECDLSHPGTPSATVATARARGDTMDYLVLSDATVVLGSDEKATAISDDRVAKVMQQDVAACYQLPTGSSEQRARILKMVRKQQRLRNQPDGYWIAGTDPDAVHHAITGHQLWGDHGDATALLTDGASCLVDKYGDTTWRGLLELLCNSGPDQVLAQVRARESTDPRGQRWPRFKPSDDATVLLLQPDQRTQ